jgi:hypothetical protein
MCPSRRAPPERIQFRALPSSSQPGARAVIVPHARLGWLRRGSIRGSRLAEFSASRDAIPNAANRRAASPQRKNAGGIPQFQSHLGKQIAKEGRHFSEIQGGPRCCDALAERCLDRETYQLALTVARAHPRVTNAHPTLVLDPYRILAHAQRHLYMGGVQTVVRS